MSPASRPFVRSVCTSTLVGATLALLPLAAAAQPLPDPGRSTLETLCTYPLYSCPSGPGSGQFGDLGMVVRLLDATGLPVPFIQPNAFNLVCLNCAHDFGTAGMDADAATDEQGRIFLTGPGSWSSSAYRTALVHGRVGVSVTLPGGTFVIDNGGAGVPFEYRTADLNGNGVVNLTDLTILASAYGRCDDVPPIQRCDFDGDGCVGATDLALFERCFSGSAGQPAPDSGSGHPASLERRTRPLFVGCVQQDFDNDGNPATLRTSLDVTAFQPFDLYLVARDFDQISTVEWELELLPPDLTVVSVTAVAPFTLVVQPPQTPGYVSGAVSGSCVTTGPRFAVRIRFMSSTGGTYTTLLFPYTIARFVDCSIPPQANDACIGSPTPCDLSKILQGSAHYLTCPGNELATQDILTVVMRDQQGHGVPGLPASGFHVALEDLLGSGEGDRYRVTPMASFTNASGQLPFLFVPREACRAEACMDLAIGVSYEGCDLEAVKRVRTLDVVPMTPYDPSWPFDQIDQRDLDAHLAAQFTLNECLDLTRRFRCPVVAPDSYYLLQTHFGHGCDATAAPRLQAAGVVVLRPNHPNPFNPATSLVVELGEPVAHAVLAVLDARGRRVRTLLDGPLAAGTAELFWDGRDTGGRPVASGVYTARFTSAAGDASVSMVLLR